MPEVRAGPIGVFGGMFDPVHHGHLRSAFELLNLLRLSQVRFVPCGRPPHRAEPVAAPALRERMLRAALGGVPDFVVDARELVRSGPCYTVDTLADLRAELPDRSLCLLLGMDAFLGLPRWHRWERVLDLAHVVVTGRPGWSAPADETLLALLRDRGTAAVEELHRSTHGRIHVQEITPLDISSSGLRRQCRAGIEPRYLVPEKVREIIVETRCYASDAETDAND